MSQMMIFLGGMIAILSDVSLLGDEPTTNRALKDIAGGTLLALCGVLIKSTGG